MSRELSPEEVQLGETVFAPIAQSLRRLIDVAIRSEAAESDARRAHALIEEAAGLLGARMNSEPYGIRTTSDGRPLPWGNVAMGIRNAIAPPLLIQRDEDGRVATDLSLGAPYEGPPGQVHGGVCALILDHLLSATAHRPGAPAFTGTLTLRYVAPTPLGRLRAEAWVDREDRGKTFATGHLLDVRGAVTVTAEGIFIRPGKS